jgi:WD40 repeat protein
MQMSYRPSFWVATAVVALSILGCSSKTPGGPSPGPSAGTSGGDSAGAGRGGSSGGATAPAGGIGGSPSTDPRVPGTGFIFQRLVPDGTSTSAHIYMFDLATQQETLITNLDQQSGQPGADLTGLSVSPDRTRIAFTSSNFRPTAVEIDNKLKLGSLWTATVDGKNFRRMTSQYPPTYNIGTMCGVGVPCPSGETCRTDRCVRKDLSVSYRHPLWAPDGKSLFFQDFQMWFSGTDTVHQFAYVGTVSDAGETTLKLPGICSRVAPLAVLPGSNDLLVARSGCREAKPGLVTFSQTPLGERAVVVPESLQLSMTTTTAALLPDGSAVLFTAEGPTPKAGSSSHRSVVQRWEIATGTSKHLYESPTDQDDIGEITVTPNGTVVVEVTTTAADKSLSGRLARLDPNAGTLEFLSLKGDVRTPR